MFSSQYPYRKYVYIDGKRLDLEAFISFLYRLWKEQKEVEKKSLTNRPRSCQTSSRKYYHTYELDAHFK